MLKFSRNFLGSENNCVSLQAKRNKICRKMKKKENLRSDGTYLVYGSGKDNPKLFARILSDGRESLYLEYYLGYSKVYDKSRDKEVTRVKHRKEQLNLFVWSSPRNPIERRDNEEVLELAKKIRFERSQELKESEGIYTPKKQDKLNFFDYFQTYIDNYTKKDIRMMKIALSRFKDFFNDTPEYSMYKDKIKPNQINKDMIEVFAEYLQSRSVGEGAKSIYKRFKKVIKYAVEHNVMKNDVCKGITIKADDNILRKDVLSPDEIQKLLAVKHERENPNIRRAFIISLFCGIRYCDVKDLTFADVDYSNKLLKFEQNKTKGHSANSGVVIPLNDYLLEVIGKPKADKNEQIFDLPSHTMCLKALRRWVKRAGIDKHITWHCARHSFAVNILNNGANIKTVASLLGHSGLAMTEKYTRAIDSLKRDAVEGIYNQVATPKPESDKRKEIERQIEELKKQLAEL